MFGITKATTPVIIIYEQMAYFSSILAVNLSVYLLCRTANNQKNMTLTFQVQGHYIGNKQYENKFLYTLSPSPSLSEIDIYICDRLTKTCFSQSLVLVLISKQDM